jgi:hypothetical protein
MGVDHRGSHIVVPEPLLNRVDIRTALQQVGGNRMTQGVGADVLGQTGPAHRHLDGLVDDARVHMMATGDASTWIHGKIPRGKDILPALFFRGRRIFSRQRMRQGHLAIPLHQVLLMPRPDPGQVVLEQG